MSDEVLRRLLARPPLQAAVELAENLSELLALNPASDAEAEATVTEICDVIRQRYQERRRRLRVDVSDDGTH